MSPDPLGLGGGTRPQGYVHNPNSWVDPLGLNGLEKGASLPADTKIYRVSIDGPYSFDFNSREMDAINKGKLNPPGVSVIRADSADDATNIWNKAFPNRPAISVGEVSAGDLRAIGYDVIHDPSKGALGQHHARLIHPDGTNGFNTNKEELLNTFKRCGD